MADEAKAATLKKLVALQAKLTELGEQQMAVVDEMGKLLAGGPGIGAILKQLEAHFSTCWRVRYGSDYAFNFAKDVPQLKRLIRILGVEELERRMLNYCRNADGYLVKARHPFGLFVSRVNDYADVAQAGGELELELLDEANQTSRMLSTMRAAGVGGKK